MLFRSEDQEAGKEPSSDGKLAKKDKDTCIKGQNSYPHMKTHPVRTEMTSWEWLQNMNPSSQNIHPFLRRELTLQTHSLERKFGLDALLCVLGQTSPHQAMRTALSTVYNKRLSTDIMHHLLSISHGLMMKKIRITVQSFDTYDKEQ